MKETAQKRLGRRRAGRPPNHQTGAAAPLTRDVILRRALEMTRTQSLADVSIVRLAEELGVRAGTIHYHLGSRQNLITGTMNLFYRTFEERLTKAPQAPNWQGQIKTVATMLFEAKVEYSGIAKYAAIEDRFRIFQRPEPGEEDYGARHMDRVFTILQRAGLNATAAAECWHLLALYVTSTAENIGGRHAPSAHADYLKKQQRRYDAQQFPGLAFGLGALASLDAGETFRKGLDDLIASFAQKLRDKK